MCTNAHICATIINIYVHKCAYMCNNNEHIREFTTYTYLLGHIYVRTYMLLFTHICATIYVVFGSYVIIYAHNEYIYVWWEHIYVLVMRIEEHIYEHDWDIYRQHIWTKMHIYVHRRPHLRGLRPERPLLMDIWTTRHMSRLWRTD